MVISVFSGLLWPLAGWLRDNSASTVSILSATLSSEMKNSPSSSTSSTSIRATSSSGEWMGGPVTGSPGSSRCRGRESRVSSWECGASGAETLSGEEGGTSESTPESVMVSPDSHSAGTRGVSG